MRTGETRFGYGSTLAARLAAAVALAALAWTLLIVLSGGVRLAMAGVVVSSRTPARPAAIFVICFALSLALAPAGSRTHAWTWLRGRLERGAVWLVLGAAATVFFVALTYGARAVSGADTFGYVSQAYLWLNGDLHFVDRLATEVPWPFGHESISPLGYRPGRQPDSFVPTYSPGLPLIMAGFHLVWSWCGPYYVQPVFAALFVLATFGLAYRLTRDRLLSAVAASCLACSPALVFNVMTPMSDTVTAALWTGSMLLLTWAGPLPAAAAGAAAALAILVRPNLLPLAAAGALAAWSWPPSSAGPPRPRARTIAFLAAIVPAILVVALLNAYLYGSPTLSGYGPASSLYAFRLFPGNVVRYSSWLFQSQGFFVLLALVPLVIRPARPPWLARNAAVPAAIFVLLLLVSYLFYVHFRDWWYLRFLLPAYPWLFVLFAAPVAAFVRAVPAVVSLPAVVIAGAFALRYWIGFVVGLGTLTIGAGEHRYVAVAEYVERELPANAVIVAMQHSSAIRFYGGRSTVRYDIITPERLSSAIAWLVDNNYRLYILLEDWEEDVYRRRFSGTKGPVATLDRLIVAEMTRPVGIRLYDPLRPFDGAWTPDRITLPDDRACRPPRGPWR